VSNPCRCSGLAGRGSVLIPYLAGYFDGEGCVYIQRTTKRLTNCLKISVQSSDLEVLQLFERTFGNRLAKGRGVNRQLWKWEASGKRAQAVLAQLLPYLRGKRDVAELAMQLTYAEHGGPQSKVSDQEACIRAEVAEKIHAINNRVTINELSN
jgi:hypothetical protein